MKRALPFLVVIALVGLAGPSTALAQGGSARTSLSGLVSDKTGGVIPGATVDVKNNATGVSNKTITNSTGQFTVPALDPGTYTVTVTLQGFKTAIVKDVVLIVGSPGNVPVTLEVGTVGEAIEVNAQQQPGADAVDGRIVHHQSHADSESAADIAQRALWIRHHAARRVHARRSARFDALRPAGDVHQHHDRRRQHQQQLPARHRRVLLDGVSAVRRGRTGHGHRRGAPAPTAPRWDRWRSDSRRGPAPIATPAPATTTCAVPA